MFDIKNSLLVVIDIQEKLAPHITEIEQITEQINIMIEGAKLLKVPIILTEQYPEGLGKTIAKVSSHISADTVTIAKRTFSCWREPSFREAVEKMARKEIIIVGIETHICVFQTASDMIGAGFMVQVMADATSSRTKRNYEIGINRIAKAGGEITGVESTLFELLETSKAPEFKALVKLIK
jgi:nicotinamidase-related amidase